MLKYILPILWMIIIFILSAMPGSSYPASCFDYAPVAHFLEFGILAWLIIRVFKLNFKTVMLTLVFCAVFAVSDEIHQMYVSNRSASLMDWLIDFLAIIVGLKIYITLKLKKQKTDE